LSRADGDRAAVDIRNGLSDRLLRGIVALNGFLVLLTAVGDNWATIRQGARLFSGGLLVLFVLTLVAVVVSTAITVRQSEQDQQS